jgi:hypothetical protein
VTPRDVRGARARKPVLIGAGNLSETGVFDEPMFEREAHPDRFMSEFPARRRTGEKSEYLFGDLVIIQSIGNRYGLRNSRQRFRERVRTIKQVSCEPASTLGIVVALRKVQHPPRNCNYTTSLCHRRDPTALSAQHACCVIPTSCPRSRERTDERTSRCSLNFH